MATIGNTVLTLADWGKRIDPSGKTSAIVELLSQTNDILTDMLFKEGNLPTGERTTVRTGLPTVGYRLLNTGVAKSKSTTAQIDAHCAILEGRSEVDKDEADLNGNTAAYRLSESQAFLEAMNQQMADTLFYGNSSITPERFTGIAPQYNSLSGTIAGNVLSAGGAATMTSVYLVVWGANTVFGVFPKGSKAGLIHEDLGVGDAFDASNNRFRAYLDRYQWKNGLVIKDWRYIVRIPNINVAHLAALSDTQAVTAATFLPKLMARAIDRVPSLNMGKMAFYANRTIMSHLRVAAMEKTVNVLSIQDGLTQFGDKIQAGLKFLGVPVRCCDRIVNTETQVS